MATSPTKTSKFRTQAENAEVLDLQGSGPHHDLKNQSGAVGDPDHASAPQDQSSQIKKSAQNSLKDADTKTQLAAELNKASK